MGRGFGADPRMLCYFSLAVSRAGGGKGWEVPTLCMQPVSVPLGQHASLLTNPDCAVVVVLCGPGLCDQLER